jgi:hypothetical protein
MYQIKTIAFPNSPLGDVVELRELTADAFFDASDEVAACLQAGRKGQYVWLSKMLWVDGQQFTADTIQQWGASAVVPLISRMQELFPEMYLDDEAEGDEEESQDPNA